MIKIIWRGLGSDVSGWRGGGRGGGTMDVYLEQRRWAELRKQEEKERRERVENMEPKRGDRP